MSIDRLLELHSPTEEEVVAEIGPGFYADISTVGGPRKQHITNLITDSVRMKTSEVLKADLIDIGIVSPQHFNWSSTTKAVKSMLGVTTNPIENARKKVIEMGLFPAELSEYDNHDVLEYVINEITRGKEIVFFSDSYVDSTTVESNRKIFSKSEQLLNYLNRIGLHSLDYMEKTGGGHDRLRKGLNLVFGDGMYNVGEARDIMIQRKILPVDFRKYKIPNGAFPSRKKAFDKIVQNDLRSVYFSKDYVKSDTVLHSNKRLFALSPEFRGYLNTQGLLSVMDMHARQDATLYQKADFPRILDVQRGRIDDMKKRLFEWKTFPKHLSDDYYADKLETIIEQSFASENDAVYFMEEYVGKTANVNLRYVAKTDEFKRWLGKQEIHSLDDADNKTAKSKITGILGTPVNRATAFRDKLAELGTFSRWLKKSGEIEKVDISISRKEFICERITYRPNLKSYYFNPEKISTVILRSNQREYLNSNAFASELILEKVFSLDDTLQYSAPDARIYRMVYKAFDGEKRKVTEARKKLIEFGVLPFDMRKLGNVCFNNKNSVLDNIMKNNFSTLYLSKDYAPDEKTLQSNRRIVAQSKQFKTYLSKNAVWTLQDLNKDNPAEFHNNGVITNALGIRRKAANEFRKGLIDLGTFSADLKDSYYDNRTDEIINEAIASFSSGKTQYYFSPKIVESKKILESNRNLFATSDLFKSHLAYKGVHSLDDLSRENLDPGLHNILGFKAGNVNQARKQLANRGTMSKLIEDYSAVAIIGGFGETDMEGNVVNYAEEICEYAFDMVNNRNFKSFYFNPELVSELELKKNRARFMESSVFLDYITAKNIDLTDLSTVRSEHSRLVFRKILGIDVTKSSDNLEGIIKTRSGKDSPRELYSEWKKPDGSSGFAELYLHRIANEAGPDEGEIIGYMTQNKSKIQEDLGRSIYACFRKMQYMGILTEPEKGIGSSKGRKSYRFPKIHLKEEGVQTQFINWSTMLDKGRKPMIIPVYAYESHVKDEDGNSQLLHATVPIKYKGSSLKRYNTFEAEILSTTQQYLSDPGSMQWNADKKHLVGETCGDDVNILARRTQDNEQYTQIFLRRRFSVNPDFIDTQAIMLKNGAEIYFFKHEQANVTFANTRG